MIWGGLASGQLVSEFSDSAQCLEADVWVIAEFGSQKCLSFFLGPNFATSDLIQAHIWIILACKNVQVWVVREAALAACLSRWLNVDLMGAGSRAIPRNGLIRNKCTCGHPEPPHTLAESVCK